MGKLTSLRSMQALYLRVVFVCLDTYLGTVMAQAQGQCATARLVCGLCTVYLTVSLWSNRSDGVHLHVLWFYQGPGACV